MNRRWIVFGLVLLSLRAAMARESDGKAGSEKPAGPPRGYSIPLIDLNDQTQRQVIVDREPGQYLGHPTTVLLEDGRTIITVYPKGHGRGAIVMKRSTDGGRTWSERLPVPENWATSKETPTIHRVVDADGTKRLILFSGLYPVRMAVSEDDGRTWTPLRSVGDWGGIVTMGCVEPLRTGKGHYLALFHDDGRFFTKDGQKTPVMTLYKTFSRDGGLTWSAPEEIYKSDTIHLCEPGLVRSPDGKQMAVLLRENRRVRNSHIIFSDDEGRTWSEPRELPGALTGDRHTGKYAPDGRLFISFRDTTHDSPTKGDWVGWVGTYDDLLHGREGQYRVRLKDNHKGADCAYPGVEVLPDGTFVTTTYGHWTAGEAPYILSVRFTLDELDALAAKQTSATERPASATVVSLAPDVRARCLSVLRDGLRADEFWPSMHAAEALTLAGQPAEVRAFLEPKLAAETDDQRRCGLARELVRAGDRAQAAVMLDILASESDYGHTHAAESLYKVGEIGDGRLLRAALERDENPKLQIMAAAALGRCGNPRALAVLRRRVADKDPEVGRTAAWVLARIGDRSDLPSLRAGAERAADALTRAYFEHALAALGDAEGRAALKRNLSHENPAVRVYAAEFAGEARATQAVGELTGRLDDPVLDVRVRAAQALLVLAQPAPPDRHAEIVRDVYPATEQNPRYSEGSIVALRDGSLLYATTEFIGGGSDHSSARIIARRSRDGGRTWDEPRLLQEQTGKQNVMSATLRWLDAPLRDDTPLGLFYLVKNSTADLKVFLRISGDGGRTFDEPIVVTAEPGYHVMNNDRVLRLSTGRLLVPVASTPDVRADGHFVSRCWLSDDGGRTWRAGREAVDLPRRGAMEPEVFELHDGRVGMILRTQLGHIACAYSADGGETWSEPAAWDVQSPEAPATLRRIPSTGDLLLVWNNTYTAGAGHGGARTPLTAAVSRDDGRTWQHVRNLESGPDQAYAYTSLTFADGRALLSYYVRDGRTGRISSRFRSLPVAWLYQPPKR